MSSNRIATASTPSAHFQAPFSPTEVSLRLDPAAATEGEWQAAVQFLKFVAAVAELGQPAATSCDGA